MDKSVDSVPFYFFNFLNSPSPGVKYLNLGLFILDNYKAWKSQKNLDFEAQIAQQLRYGPNCPNRGHSRRRRSYEKSEFRLKASA